MGSQTSVVSDPSPVGRVEVFGKVRSDARPP